jgi:hypothetical protein
VDAVAPRRRFGFAANIARQVIEATLTGFASYGAAYYGLPLDRLLETEPAQNDASTTLNSMVNGTNAKAGCREKPRFRLCAARRWLHSMWKCPACGQCYLIAVSDACHGKTLLAQLHYSAN